MLRWIGVPVASAPNEEVETEVDFCDGRVVLSGGGLAPLEPTSSDSNLSVLRCEYPSAWRLLFMFDKWFAVLGVLVAETLIVFGVVVV